jgi:aromatic-amino-acid transaminase
VGALSVLCASADEAARVLSQLKIVIRTNYSNPPTFGAQVVATVLNTPALRALWEDELATMRERIRATRAQLVQRLQALGVAGDLGYITAQKGMFSYSGLSAAQMQRLRSEFGVYGVDSGRICVAAINSRNIERVSKALAELMRG